MATVNVDVELDEFSNYELLEEINYRLHKATGRRAFTDKERNQMAIMLNQELKPKKISLINSMKIDFFNENIDKISLEQLEKLI